MAFGTETPLLLDRTRHASPPPWLHSHHWPPPDRRTAPGDPQLQRCSFLPMPSPPTALILCSSVQRECERNMAVPFCKGYRAALTSRAATQDALIPSGQGQDCSHLAAPCHHSISGRPFSLPPQPRAGVTPSNNPFQAYLSLC